MADFTCVPVDTSRFGYTAFVIDAFAGLIPGWECSLSKKTAFAEAAIRQAATYRARQGRPFTGKEIHHSDASTFADLGGEGFGVFPGQPEGVDFFVVLAGRGEMRLNLAAMMTRRSLAVMSAVDGLGLRRVPGGERAAGLGVGGVVPGGGVPADGDGLAGDHERDGALDGGRGAVAGLPGAEELLRVFDRDFDGLITNGKFCCVRRVQLSLTWWRRPLRLRRSALHTDFALVGEPDEPDLDRLPPVQPQPRRRAPVGSGLPAAGASGRAGRPARPDADR